MQVGGIGPAVARDGIVRDASPASGNAGVGGSISTPTNVQRVVHVEWDSKTSTFKGLPSVWASALPDGAQIRELVVHAAVVMLVLSECDHNVMFARLCLAGSSRTGTVDAGSLPEHVAPTAPVAERGRGGLLETLGAAFGRERAVKKEEDGGFSMVISAPFNVKHNIHVQVDPAAPTGFKGLPAQWDALLSVSGISKVNKFALRAIGGALCCSLAVRSYSHCTAFKL